MRFRGAVRWVFRSGEGLLSTTGLVPAVGSGKSFSTIFATPMTTTFFVAGGADVSLLYSCSPSNCAYIRRNRAGTRIGLPGGPKAGEAAGSIDDVEDSVGSTDEVREDG